MKKIAIIGGGFTGTMTAVQLIRQSKTPIDIILMEKANQLSTGVAYSTYSNKHLLNVVTKKMRRGGAGAAVTGPALLRDALRLLLSPARPPEAARAPWGQRNVACHGSPCS